MAVSVDIFRGSSNFSVGFLIGGAFLIMINLLFQSSTVFLSFFAGVVISGMAWAGLFSYLVINGYLTICNVFGEFALNALQAKDLPKMAMKICQVMAKDSNHKKSESPGDTSPIFSMFSGQNNFPQPEYAPSSPPPIPLPINPMAGCTDRPKHGGWKFGVSQKQTPWRGGKRRVVPSELRAEPPEDRRRHKKARRDDLPYR